jgi:hypothetical protein
MTLTLTPALEAICAWGRKHLKLMHSGKLPAANAKGRSKPPVS